ncbi:hypothetical protein SAMN05660226_00134 [Parapedobacter luteus]|uniref:Uncharacterized protein n=1 Tax=Parapedobacter luteus TaxID=623280 RepID=A0A1T4ZV82_9SPHI|nr:hypothetical protein [Parapedobacter luteus]SKB26525.1 hypothetical protein SAMN05660226_00134 [Parapedobacter luteus]
MRKYNVISWSLVIALAAMLEKTISKQATLNPIEETVLHVSHGPTTNEDEGKTIITKQKKTTTDGSSHQINEQQLEHVYHILAKYE